MGMHGFTVEQWPLEKHYSPCRCLVVVGLPLTVIRVLLPMSDFKYIQTPSGFTESSSWPQTECRRLSESESGGEPGEGDSTRQVFLQEVFKLALNTGHNYLMHIVLRVLVVL